MNWNVKTDSKTN